MIGLILLSVTCGQPQFVVENKCPQAFTVTNLCPSPSTPLPKGGGGYPVRGNLWSHPGNVHAHLKSGQHAGKWSSAWIDSLTRQEAESLHSDDHEGRVKWSYVERGVKPVPGVISTITSPAPVYTLPQFCPTGH